MEIIRDQDVYMEGSPQSGDSKPRGFHRSSSSSAVLSLINSLSFRNYETFCHHGYQQKSVQLVCFTTYDYLQCQSLT
jgi:hypothetical protein